MQTVTILTDRVNYEKDITLVRESWLRELFAFIGFDIIYLDTLSKGAVLEFFIKNKLELIYYVDLQALKVKFEGEIIGEWMGPEIELVREDGTIFNKVTIKYWSIIDQQLDIKED
jgi:hypothetical protein